MKGEDNGDMKPNNTASSINENDMKDSILIVDDSKFAIKILKDILTKENLNVVAEAQNGYEAIELAKKFKPDYVFLDVEMPSLDGLSALPKILEACSSCYIIMCTAMGQQNIIQKSIERGARDYVLKPYKKENIIGVISAAITVNNEQRSKCLPKHNMPFENTEERNELLEIMKAERQPDNIKKGKTKKIEHTEDHDDSSDGPKEDWKAPDDIIMLEPLFATDAYNDIKTSITQEKHMGEILPFFKDIDLEELESGEKLVTEEKAEAKEIADTDRRQTEEETTEAEKKEAAEPVGISTAYQFLWKNRFGYTCISYKDNIKVNKILPFKQVSCFRSNRNIDTRDMIKRALIGSFNLKNRLLYPVKTLSIMEPYNQVKLFMGVGRKILNQLKSTETIIMSKYMDYTGRKEDIPEELTNVLAQLIQEKANRNLI